jgi:Beta-ketoacyl synthase, N-terminal domain
MRLYIHAVNLFLNEPLSDMSLLKEKLKYESGKSFRRLNRFEHLVLIGALGLAKKSNLEKSTAIYLATNYGSVASTIVALDDIYREKVLPMPVDFINTAANIGGFYIASELGLLSKNICVSRGEGSFEAALELAALDIESGEVKMALIGGVDETIEPLSEFRRYISQLPNEIAIKEGSCWILVSANQEGAIGEIGFSDSIVNADVVSFEIGFSVDEQRKIANDRKIVNFYEEFGYYGSYSAFAISYFLLNFNMKSMYFISRSSSTLEICIY